MKPEIIVTITPSGEIQAEVRGAKGKECIKMTSFIDMLGEPLRTLKPEYFNCAAQVIKQSLKVPHKDYPEDAA